ncbi:hypothetical protein BATDEDRAFT_35464 [Batrachochytrium dendrobatidis JAM81]|uniref:DNA-directed RNA polymerase n=2 Tax=Batrachochytrium dendrobatidis TaxID=109871 RepID=F4P6A9_BATDJ|nr:DNA-directed RNA polymerase [Batrachochytrium dendrobatidis JAM81]EGF79316.1 hypothetical protein BATDEDRAFT_35464 [Batrachochytrium dendrobatidis JAM81]OAJ42592.1 DNA-dependent RNA polymerase [Batrachochytrium dendrobatidis JEL423]|eukprot:XP_006680012.1 hypothetical protein BATDEDRAFT_35464 [Batrachochytrium dendrobatidis JAM81]
MYRKTLTASRRQNNRFPLISTRISHHAITLAHIDGIANANLRCLAAHAFLIQFHPQRFYSATAEAQNTPLAHSSIGSVSNSISGGSQHIKTFTKSVHPHAATSTKQKVTAENLMIPELFSSSIVSMPTPKIMPAFDPLDAISTARAMSKFKLREQMTLIYACVQTGDLDRAEVVFNKSLRSNPTDMMSELQAPLINRFIEAHLIKCSKSDSNNHFQSSDDLSQDSGNHQERAQRWYERMSELHVQKNVETFAILCHYFLSIGDIEKVKSFIADLEADGSSPQKLLESHRFHTQDARAPLEALLRSMGKSVDATNEMSNTSGIPELDELMMSVLSDSNISNTAKNNNADVVQNDLVSLDSAIGSDSLSKTATFTQQELDIIEKERVSDLEFVSTTGVSILKSALSKMNDTHEMRQYNRQMWLEERSYAAALEKQKEFISTLPTKIRQLALLPAKLMDTLSRMLAPVIQEELDKINAGHKSLETGIIIPLLKLFSVKTLAYITVQEALRNPFFKSSETNNGFPSSHVKSISIVSNIGNALEREHNTTQLQSKANQKIAKLEFGIHILHTTGRLADYTTRKIAAEMLKKQTRLNDIWVPNWGEEAKVKIGTFLLHLLVQAGKIAVQVPDPNKPGHKMSMDVPAFEHKVLSSYGKTYGYIIRHAAVMEMMENGCASVLPLHLPMLVQPRPWLSCNRGGYLQHGSQLVRILNNPEHREYLKAADEANHLPLVLRAVDKLGSTAWVINPIIYKVASTFWNKKESAPSIPKPIVIPEIPKPSDYDTNPDARWKYIKKNTKRLQQISNNHSQRCDLNYKMEIARKYLGETIFFPHNLDFRGRAYPMPPNLNHIGNDLCRGLLKFKVAKPLGENGMRWLKIQVSNLAGNDKASLDNRAKFAEDHRKDIIDSAEHPLDGKRWWLKSENPWQLLATCIELNQAWKCDNPLEFMSSIHIHQDGSCNGLQHYAALGGDVDGAKVVNLTRSEVPQDVYSSVSNQVMKLVKQQAEQNVPEALLLLNRINRKLVKQTVMTNTYGITFSGAHDQVRNRLLEARVKESGDKALTDEQLHACALFATRLIFQSMGTIFEGARAIQVWLNETANIIAKSIPAEDIPPQQLQDSLALEQMGLLPKSTIVLEKERKLLQKELLKPLPDSKETMSEFSFLEEAVRADHDSKTGMAKGSVSDVDSSKSNKAMMMALTEKPTLTIKPKKDNGVPARMTSVIWTTPLGFPIVQPYRSHETAEIKTAMQSFTIYNHNDPAPVNARKQSTAFPPNFIHSLDASHMMLSAIACDASNIEFAAVHDSYWTHACDVDEMNKILREAFVRLHSENIMIRLREELIERYKTQKVMVKVPIKGDRNVEMWNQHLLATGRKQKKKESSVVAWVDIAFDELPKRGAFDIQQVRDSIYFFH